MNPSEPTLICDDCTFKTISETNLERHKLKCEYCDFVGKSIGGLKTHTRRMHNTATNCYLCEFCTFTAKTKNEVKEHTTKWNITHSKMDFNLHYEEVNCEMFALKQIGLVLLGFSMWDNERCHS